MKKTILNILNLIYIIACILYIIYFYYLIFIGDEESIFIISSITNFSLFVGLMVGGAMLNFYNINYRKKHEEKREKEKKDKRDMMLRIVEKFDERLSAIEKKLENGENSNEQEKIR